MKKFIAVLIMVSFALPVRAQLPSGFEPVEKDLIKKQQEQEMTRDVLKRQEQPAKAEAKEGSSWWKWTLGILVIGGIAAAAGGGGGGGGSTGTTDTGTGTTDTTGSTTVTW